MAATKKTLLQLTQDILNDMDSDEVNSIDDTIESVQVAQIIRATYEAMMSNRNWSHQRRLLTLEPLSDLSLPTHVRVQEAIKEMISVKYNCSKPGETRRFYQPIYWVEPDDFLRISNSRNTDDANIDVIYDSSDIELFIRNDQQPRYFTSFDDNILIFDAYDSAIDDNIMASKIQAMAFIMPDWVHEDDAVPDLPIDAFTALLEEAKSRCFVKLKQQSDVTAATEARRQQAWLSRKEWRVAGGVKYPDYGRGRGNSGKSYKDPTFRRDD
ncbi:Phage protein [Pseudomonas phage GP100]|nr:Phage protein [Pseudomonas phage GP100]